MTVEQVVAAAVRDAVREELAKLRDEVRSWRADERAKPVTVEEAAKRLGVSRRTVQRRIRDGALNVVRTGRSVRVVVGGG